MKREIIITSDGSTTIHLPDWNEQYHSKHGAIQEAYHVFIKSGLALQTKPEISILEIGFGTGLNCFITFLERESESIKKINYVGVEAYPVINEEVKKLNYVAELNAVKHQAIFDNMHDFSWDKKNEITPDFSLTKRQQFFKDIDDKEQFDLVYFDAFAAEHQPDLWTEAIFKSMFEALKENGILVTYCAKGSVRRAMQAVGFIVERLAGPPGKREMLRGIKNI
ncbi:tRNA (5-methylaminomethyl-2-thiouridine)(34)-methyltransferase MnmD [Tenacibaculum pacificus]|uniref:tRNA (5-methylaminomethyl-2-thiouridine)(34)-methyltransferase MnmD n=1 Tax=Tenacibaculum pacificus TaxID=3018314 RepID=UPI0022F3C932|nr:tRNA (5-methylaminomethyl-2-thiouridine)(34)-methyltransferase MnmD [Tenacibaculum pacificus]WBX74843.1 tRNA (5-methylaminomethyl-2-thiouridine)(34)-methyltransferase MnmD [Tenacibaculum pacificus]